jgi:exodeoxyribonuclease VIII
MPDSQYRQSEGLSNSMLKHFLRTPSHYKSALENPQETTKAMTIGTAFHQMVLTPELNLVAVMPDVDLRTNAGKKVRDDFVLLSEGKTVIKEDEFKMLSGMTESVRSNAKALQIIEACTYKEVSLFATLAGVKCKGRFDMLDVHNGIIADLKSCEDASPNGAFKAIRNFGYDMQNVHYGKLYEACFGALPKQFVFIFVEKEPPYAVGIYVIGAKSLERTTAQWQKALNDFSVCQETNVWGAYSNDIVEIEV